MKKRLKQILNDKVVYADGLTPQEIAQRLRTESCANTEFISSDLEKQDRQTDQNILDCEFQVYRMLGINEGVLQLWR